MKFLYGFLSVYLSLVLFSHITLASEPGFIHKSYWEMDEKALKVYAK